MSANLAKVLFDLGEETETLWAEELGPGMFRLDNTPFYAMGVSCRDIVLARPSGGLFQFVEVFKRGGHSTYRLLPTKLWDSHFAAAWKPLAELGCTFEGGPARLHAVDVPPASNIFDVYAALERGEQDEVWTFEEGHCGHAVG